MAVLLGPDHSLTGNTAEAGDLKSGGQNGHIYNPSDWVANTSYVRQDLIAVLIAPPTAMQYMPDGEDRIRMLKQMVEVHAQSVTGIEFGLEVEYSTTPVGDSGAELHVAVKTTQAQSVPSFLWIERRGKVITKFFMDWIRLLIQDPHLKKPGIIKEPAYIALPKAQKALLQDAKSMMVLFIEPSESMEGVVDAVMVANMMPQSVENAMSKTAGEALEIKEIEMAFTGYQYEEGVKDIAQAYLDTLDRDGMDPSVIEAFNETIDPSIQDDTATLGYRPGVDVVAQALGVTGT